MNFIVSFRNEAGNYFVNYLLNDSCREFEVIVHIFHLTRECGCGTGFEIYLEFNSFAQDVLLGLNDQLHLVCSMNKIKKRILYKYFIIMHRKEVCASIS